jgi:hypothetical protein
MEGVCFISILTGSPLLCSRPISSPLHDVDLSPHNLAARTHVTPREKQPKLAVHAHTMSRRLIHPALTYHAVHHLRSMAPPLWPLITSSFLSHHGLPTLGLGQCQAGTTWLTCASGHVMSRTIGLEWPVVPC